MTTASKGRKEKKEGRKWECRRRRHGDPDFAWVEAIKKTWLCPFSRPKNLIEDVNCHRRQRRRRRQSCTSVDFFFFFSFLNSIRAEQLPCVVGFNSRTDWIVNSSSRRAGFRERFPSLNYPGNRLLHCVSTFPFIGFVFIIQQQQQQQRDEERKVDVIKVAKMRRTLQRYPSISSWLVWVDIPDRITRMESKSVDSLTRCCHCHCVFIIIIGLSLMPSSSEYWWWWWWWCQ